MEFRVDKLNRIITFVGSYVIKNLTNSDLFCVRYNENKVRIDEEEILLEKGDLLPVEKDWGVQFSFNKKSFTILTQVKSMESLSYLKSESNRFKLAIVQRKTVSRHVIFQLKSPLIISNCLPKDIKIQFVRQGKTLSTKDIAAQTSHEVFADEDIHELRFKVITDGFYWSQ